MPLSRVSHVRGLVLAAGSGTRMGGPKALVHKAVGDPTWVERTVQAVRLGGCDGVTVVVGAAADEVADLVARLTVDGEAPHVVRAHDWHEGMGASLRAGLTSLMARDEVGAALVTLVDLPDVGPDVVRRLIERARPDTPAPSHSALSVGLSRAAYGGVPGHPVLIGRAHWEDVVATAHGDRGARDYLAQHPPVLVECGDLATGRDADTPADLGT